MCKKIYRALAREVAKEMVVQLEANQHKGDRKVWINMKVEDLMRELFYHASKLQGAIERNDKTGIKEYAADVANIAGMVMDKSGVIDLDKIDNSRHEKVEVHSNSCSSF
jgi:hypothetical protein